MPGRWVDSPEPVPMVGQIGSQPFTLYNPNILNSIASGLRYIDIYAGFPRILDIAARFDDEADCYGWNNENYFSQPIWRNPNWRLLPDSRYLVSVKVEADAATGSALFRLVNDGTIESFRLEQALPDDLNRIS